MKILEMLQRNSKISLSKLSSMLGRPRTTVGERIAKLEREGYILGYKAIVDPRKLGYKYVAFVMLKVRRKVNIKGESNQEVLASKIMEDSRNNPSLPYVEEAHIVTGAYDLILKVWARSWNELTNFLIKYLASLEDVVWTETFLALRSISKPLEGFPIRHGSEKH